MNKPMMTFAKWWAELKRLARSVQFPLGDKAAWRQYHADEYTPGDALSECLSYGDS